MQQDCLNASAVKGLTRLQARTSSKSRHACVEPYFASCFFTCSAACLQLFDVPFCSGAGAAKAGLGGAAVAGHERICSHCGCCTFPFLHVLHVCKACARWTTLPSRSRLKSRRKISLLGVRPRPVSKEKGYDLLVHDFRTKEQTHSDNVDRTAVGQVIAFSMLA